MAFLQEDGTGIAGANSYNSVAEFEAYHNDRDNDISGITSPAGIQFALIKATDYVELRFRLQFLGYKEFPETPQGLSFPRLGIIDRDGQAVEGIPTNLKNAINEYALRASVADLAPDPVLDASGKSVVREKVGPLEVQYTSNDFIRTIKPYPMADKWLSEYLTGAGGVIRG